MLQKIHMAFPLKQALTGFMPGVWTAAISLLLSELPQVLLVLRKYVSSIYVSFAECDYIVVDC